MVFFSCSVRRGFSFSEPVTVVGEDREVGAVVVVLVVAVAAAADVVVDDCGGFRDTVLSLADVAVGGTGEDDWFEVDGEAEL